MLDRVSDNLLQQHIHKVFQYFSTDGLKKKKGIRLAKKMRRLLHARVRRLAILTFYPDL